MGASLGWVVVCSLLGLWDQAQPLYQIVLFAYVTLGALASFGSFGYLVGRHEQRFAELSLVDHLTRAYNTRYFHETLKAEFANAARYERPLALILLDLDHFKQVNDTHGHPAGDEVLKSVVEIVRSLVRSGDTLARVGGEEFAVIMPNSDSAAGFALAERIRLRVKQRPVALPDGGRITIRVSVGVAATDKMEVETFTALFAAVDDALYAAKQAGRDRVVVADHSGAALAALADDSHARTAEQAEQENIKRAYGAMDE
ncbi:diguanylate cyclase [Desulfovibrio sp. X2]|nr:diguanylate cyclase [Desulfovibrio sp. X2]